VTPGADTDAPQATKSTHATTASARGKQLPSCAEGYQGRPSEQGRHGSRRYPDLPFRPLADGWTLPGFAAAPMRMLVGVAYWAAYYWVATTKQHLRR
jgi:hypothetical protein